MCFKTRWATTRDFTVVVECPLWTLLQSLLSYRGYGFKKVHSTMGKPVHRRRTGGYFTLLCLLKPQLSANQTKCLLQSTYVVVRTELLQTGWYEMIKKTCQNRWKILISL